jgi:hypothetical protein
VDRRCTGRLAIALEKSSRGAGPTFAESIVTMGSAAIRLEPLRRAGDLIDNRFVVERVLGGVHKRGSAPVAGIVVRAWDRVARATVALRTGARDADSRMFAVRAEGRAAAIHPACARIVVLGEASPTEAYVVTEWVEGEDLGKLASKRPLPLDGALDLVRRIAEGIRVLNRRGASHGAVALERVLVPAGDLARAKLVGLERALFLERGRVAPRSAEDAREDVHGLALVLYGALGGDVSAARGQRFVPLRRLRSDVPPELDELLSRALATDGSHRPDDVAALLADLEAVELVTQAARGARSTASASPSGQPGTLGAAATSSKAAQLVTVLALRSSLGSSLLEARLLAEGMGATAQESGPGTLTVFFQGDHGAREPAERAARTALAIRSSHAPISMSLATGCDPDPRAESSPVLAAALFALPDVLDANGGPVHLDSVTARLVEGRFALAREGESTYLHEERSRRSDPPPALRGTPFTGRERENAMLDATFAECVEERVARAIVLRGEGGVGKSRLVQEFVRRVKSRGLPCEVWSAHAEPFRQQSPFGVLAQLARAAAGILDGEAARSRDIKLKARVARHAANTHVGWVADGLAEIAGSGRVGTTDLGDVWSTFVSAECVVHPLILVVEDLQWIDGPSLRLLERTCADLKNVPLLLVLVERTEPDAPPRSWRSGQSVELPVGELPRAEMEKLAVHLVGDAVQMRTGAASQGSVLVDRARGNVRALLDAVRDAEGATQSEPARAIRRFARLGPDAQRLLALGSVFGIHFLPGVVARFASRHGEAFVAARPLDELLREELVHEAPRGQFHGEPEYVFRDVSLWNASASALSDEEKQAAHKYVARWLEDAGEPDSARLAEHYRRGGEAAEADRVGLLARALRTRA